MTIEEFRKVMAKRNDADLVKILTFEKDQFQPEAITAAEEELKKRNLTVDQLQSVKTNINIAIEKETEKANQPLELYWKALAFILPGLINLIFSGGYTVDGYLRKARELRWWTFFGVVFYVGIIIIIFSLDSTS